MGDIKIFICLALLIAASHARPSQPNDAAPAQEAAAERVVEAVS